jgi:hypothetical protein
MTAAAMRTAWPTQSRLSAASAVLAAAIVAVQDVARTGGGVVTGGQLADTRTGRRHDDLHARLGSSRHIRERNRHDSAGRQTDFETAWHPCRHLRIGPTKASTIGSSERHNSARRDHELPRRFIV